MRLGLWRNFTIRSSFQTEKHHFFSFEEAEQANIRSDWEYIKVRRITWDVSLLSSPSLFNNGLFPEFTGKYAYIESSEPQASGDKAVLVSDMMTGQQCMRFKYHMHGEDTASLSIYRRGFLVWKEIGNHGNRWLQGQVDFDCSMSQYQVSYPLK